MPRGHVLELVEFCARPEIPEEAIAEAVDRLEQALERVPGFVSQTLYRAEDGGLLLVYRWRTLEEAKASQAAMTPIASFRALLDRVEVATIGIRCFLPVASVATPRGRG